MARGGKRIAKPLIEDSDSEDRARVPVAAATEETSEDDAEANAYLSLLVAERAKLRWLGALNDSLRAGTNMDLASSLSVDTVDEVNGEVKGTKKKKKKVPIRRSGSRLARDVEAKQKKGRIRRLGSGLGRLGIAFSKLKKNQIISRRKLLSCFRF